jgi:hypothetical protein
MAAAEQPTTYVLTLEAVRWGIAELKRSKVHPFFLAYLHLRKHASEQGTDTGISADWDELGEYLAVPGGPPGKPYYRPVWNGNVNNVSRYWLNPNIAGSYAPSSLRGVPRKVIDTNGSQFILRPNHTQRALTHLLYNGTISSLAFAAFFYRDHGFAADDLPEPADLEMVLRRDLRFADDDDDFKLLFHTVIPGSSTVKQWFIDIDDDPAGVE